MTYRTILTELIDNCTGLITMNRPDAANALNRQMAEELAEAISAANQAADVRAIILTGSGARAFCAGADLKERRGMSKSEWHAQHEAFEKASGALLASPKPIIAAVNGVAMGGGLELAISCDFIYAANTARMGLPEASLGIMPGMGGTQLLARAIGTARAREALYLGEIFSAEEAHGLGLVNRICAPEDLLPHAISTALAIAANAPLSIAAIKHAINEGISQPLDVALRTELRHYHSLLETHDRHEGINAFNEKRRPKFNGN